MALRTPPSWLQQGSHPAENDRLTTQAIFATSGVISANSLAVTANSSPNMSVNVAAGWAAIVATTLNAGVYVAYNDGATNLTVTAANGSLARIDRVVVTVNDAFYSGLLNNVTFTVIAGTPAASPAAPAIPPNSISLALIAVGAAVTTIVTGNITDTRTSTSSNMMTWTTALRPVSPAIGTFGFNLTLLQMEYYDGTIWQASGGAGGFDSFLLMGA